jgi:hypothetical protein
LGLPSYDDDDAHGLDLIAANTTGVLEDVPSSIRDPQILLSGSLNFNDSNVLDAIPRSPRSILISGGVQRNDGSPDRSFGTSWWRPGKDLWRKKNLQRLVTQLGVPLPAGSFSPAERVETLSSVLLDKRRSTPASTSAPAQSSTHALDTSISREKIALSPLQELLATMAPTTPLTSPKTSPSKSPSKTQKSGKDVGVFSSARQDLASSRPASTCSNASADHASLGFVGNQAPLVIDEPHSLDRESSHLSSDGVNTSSPSKASQWLHVIMQLIPPPISGSGSVETLSASDSSTTSSMNILDKTPACDCVRVALIFRGSDGSSAPPSSRFLKLVYGLGRLVPLASAAARDIFTGGLDTTGSRHGSWALHCSSASAQAVFYVPALIELEIGRTFDASTKQSIDGLVGNCYVTIVYTENEFEVAERSHLLVGDFHWLVITVQPVSGGRNRVLGRMKPGHPQLSIFGPTAKIVSDEALPALLQVSLFVVSFYLFIVELIIFSQCAVMTAEVACRIISSGEENYVSSRQERIGLFHLSAHSLFPTTVFVSLNAVLSVDSAA